MADTRPIRRFWLEFPQIRAFWLTVCKTVGPGRLNQVRRGANMKAMSYVLPRDVDERPISVIGGGTLGRRIAMMFSAGGSRVQLFSRSAGSREAARRFVDEHASDVREQLGLAARSAGTVELFDTLEPAVATAWLIIEAVSEDLALKKQVFRELGRLAESDAILATNSSSYPSSRLLDAVESPERLLNVHFQMPPELIAVELMSCGRTDAAVIDALAERLPRYGFVPFTVMRESVGFLFNRIWAAIKRECLMVVAEGVSTPEEVDRIWRLSLGTALGPFRMMDRIGLDVALAVEEHYATIRDGIPAAPRELLRDYVDKGFIGLKSGRGFYDDYGD